MPEHEAEPTTITLGGRSRTVRPHPTEFLALAPAAELEPLIEELQLSTSALGPRVTRLAASTPAARDAAMARLTERAPVQAIYQIESETDTGGTSELLPTGRLRLRLDTDDPALVASLATEYALEEIGRMGDTIVLQPQSGAADPVALCNAISTRPGVAYCTPDVFIHRERMDSGPGSL